MQHTSEAERTATALESQRAGMMAALRRAVPELSRAARFQIEEYIVTHLLTVQEHAEFRTFIEQAPKTDSPAGYVRRAFERFREQHRDVRKTNKDGRHER